MIEDAIITAFSESTFQDEPDLLEKCYVKTPERIRFDRRIRMHIAKCRPVLKTAAQRPMKGKDERVLVDLIASASARTRPVAVLLVGLVGAGKTTFLNYTRKVAARELFEATSGRPEPHWIYVDFRSLAPEEPAIDYLYSDMKRHIQADDFLSDYERCVKHAYRGETDALLRGPLFLLADDESERKRRITDLLMAEYAATVPYVEKVLTYTAGNAPVFLVIDNVDQFEDPDKQAEIFADAMAIAHRMKLNLILALRDATYVRNRTQPIFDAFDFDPIYIDPPQVGGRTISKSLHSQSVS